jgi:hypothetical protein
MHRSLMAAFAVLPLALNSTAGGVAATGSGFAAAVSAMMLSGSADADIICNRTGCHDRPNCKLIRRGTGPDPISRNRTVCNNSIPKSPMPKQS